MLLGAVVVTSLPSPLAPLSSAKAYARRDRSDVRVLHAVRTARDKAFACGRRVANERVDVDAVTGRRERSQPVDALAQKHARAVEVPVAPVVEADADLQDAVIQVSVRRARRSPQQLERLVLLEELAAIELFDATDELVGCGLVAARTRRLIDRAAGDTLGGPRRVAVAAICRRALTRGRCDSEARLR